MQFSLRLMLCLGLACSGFGQALAQDAPFPGQKVKKPLLVAHYGGAKVKCWNSGTLVLDADASKGLSVFQYEEDKQHLWLNIAGEGAFVGDVLLGADATCTIIGNRTAPIN